MTEYYFEAPTIEDLETIESAFAEAYKYQEEVSNPDYDENIEGSLELIPNPITKEDFMLDVIENYLVEVIASYKMKQFDNGLLTQEEYSIGKPKFLQLVRTLSKEKINLRKKD